MNEKSSMFSYNVTRDYPYRWFTPTVFVGGVIATALASFLSVATQGYETVAVYSREPNATDLDQTMFAKWPSFLTANTKSTCSSTSLPVNSEIYTNNTALAYKLSAIWGTDDADLAGSLPYSNQLLEDCSIAAIEINYQGIERAGLQIARQQWGAALKAYITCSIPTPDGLTRINMTTGYDVNPGDRWYGSSGFSGRNQTAKASLWWGESLLGWYSIAAVRDIQDANTNFSSSDGDKAPVFKGYVSFVPKVTGNSTADDITSLDFFVADCFFLPFSDDGVERSVYYCNSHSVSDLMNANESNGTAPLPGIWLASDSLAKAFYFTVLADLGQQKRTPNMLADKSLLAYFSKNITAIASDQGPFGSHLHAVPGLAGSPFTASDQSAPWLGIHPSVISTTYLCQVPRLKSTSTLVVSILLNDIVILSALWGLVKFAIDYFLLRRDPSMNWCSGCQRQTYGLRYDESHALAELSKPSNPKTSPSLKYTAVAQLDPLSQGSGST